MTISAVNEWIKETGSLHDFNSLSETFWRRVDKSGSCWMWLGQTHRQGYGFFKVGGKNKLAHRLAFMLANERVPGHDIKLLHSCDVTACVNPEHLSEGSQRDNVMDMVNKGRHVGSSKLTDDQVQAIREDPRPQVVIENDYGLAKGTASKIKSGTIYSSVAGNAPLTFDLLQLEIRRETDKLVESGELIPESECTECGSKCRVRAHHVDYSKSREVNWWCKKCRQKWIRRHSFQLCTFASDTLDSDIGQVMSRYLYHFRLPDRNNVKLFVGVANKPFRQQRGTQDALA